MSSLSALHGFFFALTLISFRVTTQFYRLHLSMSGESIKSKFSNFI